MSEKQETEADIIAEMRNLGKLYKKSTDRIRRSLIWFGLRTYADRLVAEMVREHHFAAGSKMGGNPAALREALLKCSEIAIQWEADEMDGVAGTTDKPEARSASEAITAILMEINAALSAPPRNCDVGTPEQQAKRFEEFCNSHTCTMDDCKVRKSWRHFFYDCGLEIVSCGLIFAQMPYEEGGAE